MDLKHLLNCQYIYMLRGWEDSYGAKVELDLSWSSENCGEYDEPRDIDAEKREATHVSIDFIVNGDRYRGLFDEINIS